LVLRSEVEENNKIKILLYSCSNGRNTSQKKVIRLQCKSRRLDYLFAIYYRRLGSIGGTKGELDIIDNSQGGYGWMADEVRIPVAGNAGNTGSFASAYGHAWTSKIISAALSYTGINLDGSGDHWSWQNSFTIGTI
jgi:hypothetical protein